MNERKESSLIGWSGILLFSLGTLGTVLMFMAMKEEVPLEQKGPFVGPYAAGWKFVFGIFPSLFINAAFLFLGARLFIKGGTATLFRNLAACTALAVALSIFFGALSTGAGGAIGAHTGEVVAVKTHATLGALIGLAAMFAAVWFGWLRGQAGLARPAGDATSTRASAAPIVAPAKPVVAPSVVRPVAPRSTAVAPAPVEEGVTAAESAALFPLDEPAIESVGAPTPIGAASASETPIAPAPAAFVAPNQIPRSPYPEDVRRKGMIPPGTKPLEPAAGAAEAPAAPSVYRWTAPGSTQDATAAREASEAGAADEVREAVVADHDELDALASAELETEEIGTEPLRTEDGVERESAGAVAVPAPSWEQPVLFRPEEGDEEPVDAYGTPLTLVEKLRQARRAGGLERGDHEVIDPESALEELEADPFEEGQLEETELADETSGPEPVVAVTAARLHELEEFEENADEASDVMESIDEDAEEGTDEDELYEEGFRPVVRGGKVPRELDEEAGAVDELDEDADEEDIVEDEADADEMETAAGERELELPAPVASLEPFTPPAIEIAPARAEPVQAGLFDAPATTAPAPVAPTPIMTAPKSRPVEREVVLQPVAAVPAERAVKSSPATMPRPKLLAEVGCLFIERGRVAVSMLQRQYEMDFDEACKVLDELQEMGLIGPYLGGQRRDILLTREQWLERVEKTGAAR